MRIPLLLTLVLLFPAGPVAHSLTNPIQAGDAKRAEDVATKLPEFEVATVKPSNPEGLYNNAGVSLYPGGRVVISFTTLKNLVGIAFGLPYWQISGGDAWVEKDNYEIEAKPPESQQASFTNLRYSWREIGNERLRQMLQALLIDRFQLRFHRETKTGTVFLLERSGKPLKLRPTEAPSAPTGPAGASVYSGDVGFAGGRWVIANTSMPQLAKYASAYIVHAPVEDRTGLSGSFDYKQPAPPSDADVNYADPTDYFLRLIPELGLRLIRTKGPVEIFVIDHAEKPSPN